MNQPLAFPIHQRFTADRSSHSSPRALAQTRHADPKKNYRSLELAEFEAMAFWSRIYDLRGEALQPWDGAALYPVFVQPSQSRDVQTAQAVEDAVTAERNRLARELHDAVTQTLFAACLIAEALPGLWEVDEAEARQSTEELRQLTRGALAEMRTLLFELRPAALSQARLCDLLKQLSEAVTGRKRLPICLEIDGDHEIPCDVKVELYRMVQESLNNVVKYARATRVEIRVRIAEDQVHMEVKDDGIGFDTTSVKPTSLGLRIMRERAEAIHATLQVASQPGMGTTVSVDWHR